jgi:hypothetical protein
VGLFSGQWAVALLLLDAFDWAPSILTGLTLIYLRVCCSFVSVLSPYIFRIGCSLAPSRNSSLHAERGRLV